MADLPDLAGVRHEYLDAGGLRMHVVLAGPEDAPAIVLVHGWPQNWWAWRNVIPALAERFRVIAPDLRGHGWSEAPWNGYEKEQLATDVLAVLDTLGIASASWIGHDWGGWTGFLAAMRAPERLERMLALSIPHLWRPAHPRQLALLGYQGPLSLPLIGPRVAGPMARAVLRAGRGSERLPAGDLALFVEHIPPAVTVAMYRTFLTRELVALARGRFDDSILQVPTKLMIGSRDPVTKGISGGPVDGQPKLEVEVLGDVGHWLPEMRTKAIIDWAANESV